MDLISRQAAIEAIVNTPTDVYSHDRIVSVLDGAAFRQNEIIDIINALPSAQPEPSQVARDICTILENERDMRVILKNAQKERVMSDLKPCPFCGGSAVETRTDDNGISWYIFCNNCGLIAGYSITKEDLVGVWNRRAKDD